MSQLLLLSRLAGNQRAILHLDLDCFYCQVEAKRLGIPPDLPAAVQQWNLLIAINYAAKARGVKRINNVADALAVCPELKLMHVMTYSADKPPAYYDNPDQRTHKACLNPYRTESGKFFGVLGKMQKCVLEKGGLDEGFMDVTAAVDSEFAQLCRERSIDISSEAAEKEVVDDRIIEKLELDWSDLSVVATGDASQTDETNANLMKWRWRDVQMWMAAKVAKQLRQQVYDKLQYRCSAGIAHNKLLAKLGSAMNKPNNQTVILEKYIDSVMENIPIDKMRNMGGKLGTTVKETFNVETAGELRAVPLEQLVKHLGNDQGNYVYRYCRGIDDSEVRARTEIKSMSSTKSLGKPAASLNEAHRWIEMVSLEIMSRILMEFDSTRRWPTTLKISGWCIRNNGGSASPTAKRSWPDDYQSWNRQGPFPSRLKLGKDIHDEDLVGRLAIELFDGAHATSPLLPLLGVSVGVGNFVKIDASEGSMDRWLAKRKAVSTSASEFTSTATATATAATSTTTTTTTTTTAATNTATNTNTAACTAGEDEGTHDGIHDTEFPDLTSAENVNTKKHKPDAEEDSGKGSVVQCEKCMKPIPISELHEHTDYHLALELQQEERQIVKQQNQQQRQLQQQQQHQQQQSKPSQQQKRQWFKPISK